MPFLKEDMELFDLFEEAETETPDLLEVEGATEPVSVDVDGALSTKRVAALSFSSRSSIWVNS